MCVKLLTKHHLEFVIVGNHISQLIVAFYLLQVVNNWEGLKSVFKFIDRNGCATITVNEMKVSKLLCCKPRVTVTSIFVYKAITCVIIISCG